MGHESRESARHLWTRPGAGRVVAAQAVVDAPEAMDAAEPDEDARFVYAIGRIEPRFPSLGIEKELVQATGRADTAGLTDRASWHKVLGDRQNRYLARMMCWVLTIEGLDVYVLEPDDPGEIDMLVDALREDPAPGDVDVVIGELGPLSDPDRCNGLVLPTVEVTQVYSFNSEALIKTIRAPQGMKAEDVRATGHELLPRITQIADNTGAADEHRAVNYLAVRYPEIYTTAASCYKENYSLEAIETRESRLSGARRMIDVVLVFRHRQTDVSRSYFVRVDVTEEFPFVHTAIHEFLGR